MVFSELNRFYSIIRIMLRYGLGDFIPKNKLFFLLRIKNRFLLRFFNKYPQLILGERFRLALQELGPIWIKFGQMLSTRRDIFSSSVIDHLLMLQDRVQPFDGALARTLIEESIGSALELWFEEFQETPLASASIAQVHSARFKVDGSHVVIKVIRPGILSIIKKDIGLMYVLAKWSHNLISDSKKFKFLEIVSEYEKNLFDELNLLKETANTIQLRRNFKSSDILYVPKVYVDFCSKNVMVMERIYGIPVYEMNELKNLGVNMKLLAERGLEIFFIQVFRDSFFHGDMHPGNVFISNSNPENPKYISIDCGIVGSLNKKDKYYLAANFIAFFNRDYKKIAELHLDSGWIPMSTNIQDFECAMRTVFEPIFEQPLEEIPFSNVLIYLFNIARCFQMEIQPQLILFQKTLLYVEDMVRQLYPSLNLWKSTKPFLEKWMRDQIKLSKVISLLRNKIPFWLDEISELPMLLCSEFKSSNTFQRKLESLSKEFQKQRSNNTKVLFLFGVGLTCVISGMLWMIQDRNIKIIPIFLILFGIFVWRLGWKQVV